MADPVTNIEFDDVLSSIRRLVSEKNEETSDPTAKDNGRFVLTPAFRVDDAAPSVLGGAPDVLLREQPADSVKAVETATSPLEPLILSNGIFAHRRAAPEADDNFPETMRPVEQTGRAEPAVNTLMPDEANSEPDTKPLFEPEQAAAKATEQVDSAQFQNMAAAWSVELARMSDAREQKKDREPPKPAGNTLELRIAELEDAVNKVGDDWEPDGSEPEATRPPRHHIFEVVDSNRPDEQVAEIVDDFDDDPEAVEPAVFNRSANETERPFVLSNPPSQEPVAETEADEKPAFASNVAHLSDRVSGGISDRAQTPAGVVEDDDVFLDVEALRTMISEVVREELRGTMGERITLNLRRMIRQEIENALLPSDKS